MKRRWYILVLFDVHLVIFDKDDSTFVVILVTVVGRAKHCNYTRERRVATPSVHFVPVRLHLVRADN